MLDAVQLCNGLGAGNIGDELMNRAFWDALPAEARLAIEILPNFGTQHAPYPQRHVLRPIGWDGTPLPVADGRRALLVGDTPVTETLGLDWPLRFLAPRLAVFHQAGLPVDVVGAGIEPLRSDAARALFTHAFLPVRSWTVRSEQCRAALLALNVPAERIAVGADWAWLYRPRRDLHAWGAGVLAGLGVDPARPVLIANVVNEIWGARDDLKTAVAAALDAAVRTHGVQLVFFCNEARDGAFYDRAATDDVRARLRADAAVIPNRYYDPDEALGLLSHATVVLAFRYHVAVEAVLAGVPPVLFGRSEKMQSLADDLGLPLAATPENVRADQIVAALARVMDDVAGVRAACASARAALAERADRNLRFLEDVR